MDAEQADHQQRAENDKVEEDENTTAAQASGPSTPGPPNAKPRKSALKKSASAGPKSSTGTNEFDTFSRSGIQRVNPFQSSKSAIFGNGSSKKSPLHDAWSEREMERRRDEQDAEYFNELYSDDRGEGQAAPKRQDEDYAFLRRRSDLPLHKLSRGQLDTARELHFDREGGEASALPTDSVWNRAHSASPARRLNPFARPASASQNGPGAGLRSVQSAARASDEHLINTVEYLESFLARARSDAQRRRQLESPWKLQLERMGGPEAIGRAAAEEDDDDLRTGRSSVQPSSARRSRSYERATIGSDPWGASHSTPRARSSTRRAMSSEEEFQLAKLETELFALKRQAAGITSPVSERERQRQIDLALANVRDRTDIESSIALLKDYTSGRPLADDRAEEMARSLAARLFAEEPEHTPKERIPTHHPHRTGKNHQPSQCVYCKRELDWQSWNTKVINLLDRSFPDRSPTWKTPSKRMNEENKNRTSPSPSAASTSSPSRLRSLATSMFEKSRSVRRENEKNHCDR